MCGRVTLTGPDVRAIASLIEADVAPQDAALYRPRYNGAPTDQLWIAEAAAQGRVLRPAVWGFPGPRGLVINARSETAEQRFHDAFAHRRVVVPADGFYEWTGPRNARRPLWFRPRGGGLLYLAGLAQPLPDGRLAFVVLTTGAAGPVAQAHHRMPALLSREAVGAWLARPESALLVPAPAGWLTVTEVSARVNDVRNDDPSVLVPDGAAPRAGQLELF